MNMKRISALLLALVMIFSLCACGKDPKKGDGSTLLFDYADMDSFIKVPDYKNFTLDSQSEEFIDLLSETMKSDMDNKKLGEEVEVASGTVEDGDTVHIVYVGKHNGVAFNGGSTGDAGTDLVIGSGSYIDGFEEGLIGVRVGETKVLNLTFPDPYPNNTELSGAAVEFTVTVESIKRVNYPALDEETAKALGFDSVSAYNTDVFTRSAQTYLIEKLLLGTELIKTPEKEIEYYTKGDMDYYKQTASAYGSTIEAMTGMKEEEFKKQIEDNYRANIAQYMAVYYVAKAEKLTVTEKEIDEQVAEMAKSYNISVEQFLQSATREQVEQAMLYDAVQEYLFDTVTSK